jgi:iron complex transport system substrate-binding protein
MRMRRIVIAILVLLLPGLPARAASLEDATGRTVPLPDHIARVLPAGPPAAVLLAALAPDLMLGWPMQLGNAARAALPPEVAALPPVPHLAATPDAEDAVRTLHPDVIVDYGTVSATYISRAEKVQADTGIPTVLLDGRLENTPAVLRGLGAALGHAARGAELAAMTEAVLALPVRGAPRRVLYARGPEGMLVAAPGTGNSEIFARLGWTVLAPPGNGTFRPATVADIAALDPDIVIFADSAARQAVTTPGWQAVRAVREGHAYIAPAAPFGWVEEPPSLNRLLGLAWLGGSDAATVAALFGAVMYGHTPSPAELAALAASVAPLPP